MQLEKQVCSLELAKRLKELKVRQESEFYWVITMTTNYHLSWYPNGELPDVLKTRTSCCSAFTAVEIGEMLPAIVSTDKESGKMAEYFVTYAPYDEGERSWMVALDGCTYDVGSVHQEVARTEADARAKMLIYLLENKLIGGVGA